MLLALSPGALPSELLIAQHMPYDSGDEADHSRAVLDDAHRTCEGRGLKGRDLLSTLPLHAVKLWREKPIQRRWEGGG